MSYPIFTILTPMYNRAKLIERAISSCLRQDFADFEMVIVDDGSTDNSVEVVRQVQDKRVRLILHPENRGVCPARNTGLAAAQGHWIVYLDSDDELLPNALSTVWLRLSALDDDIASMIFNYRRPSGMISPDPPLVDEVLDYHDYVRWIGRVKTSADYLRCVRRDTFPLIQFPEGRAYEMSYTLDFSMRYKTQSCSDIICLKHSGADNQLTTTFDEERARRDAPDCAAAMEKMLKTHGDILRKLTPQVWLNVLRMTAIYHLQDGQRLKGAKFGAKYLIRKPHLISFWGLLSAGLVGPDAVSWLRRIRNRLH